MNECIGLFIQSVFLSLGPIVWSLGWSGASQQYWEELDAGTLCTFAHECKVDVQ